MKPQQISLLDGEYLSNSWSQGKYRLRRNHVGPQIECGAVAKLEEQANARK